MSLEQGNSGLQMEAFVSIPRQSTCSWPPAPPAALELGLLRIVKQQPIRIQHLARQPEESVRTARRATYCEPHCARQISAHPGPQHCHCISRISTRGSCIRNLRSSGSVTSTARSESLLQIRSLPPAERAPPAAVSDPPRHDLPRTASRRAARPPQHTPRRATNQQHPQRTYRKPKSHTDTSSSLGSCPDQWRSLVIAWRTRRYRSALPSCQRPETS